MLSHVCTMHVAKHAVATVQPIRRGSEARRKFPELHKSQVEPENSLWFAYRHLKRSLEMGLAICYEAKDSQ